MGRQLDRIIYDEGIALAHADERRAIYEPERVFDGVEGNWYAHNIIVLKSQGLELGNHFHDYVEAFFTPTGEFDFKLVDLEDLSVKKYTLKAGSRIVIPERVGHVITGSERDVLMGYGNVPFDPKRLISCTEEQLRALSSIK